MSTYNGGRRGPNVSQYLRDLNAISPSEPEENFAMEDDLAMFTNAQFFDFETGQTTEYHPSKAMETTEAPSVASPTSESTMGDMSGIDFITGDFNFTDFNSYTTPSLATFPDNLGNLQPLQPSPQTVYSPTLPQQPGGFNGSSDQPGRARSASRRESDAGASASGRQMSYEDASRLVAEEDKRRRNTAASARFRIKKKQREQALEKSAKEMTDKVTSLEGRISQLETENKWLKNLIMEKNESGGEDIATMWQKQQVASTSASPTTESSEKKSGRHSSKESKSSSSGSSTMKKEN